MEGYKQQAVLLELINALREAGSWCGETHIQKSVFFLQEGLDVPIGLKFFLYKHGPFSFGLRELLGEMKGNLFLDVESRSPYGPKLLPSEIGLEFAKGFPKTIQHHSHQINFVAAKLANKDVVGLERVGTALYVLEQFPGISEEEAVREIVDLKPHIQDNLALDAVHEVHDILEAWKQVVGEPQSRQV